MVGCFENSVGIHSDDGKCYLNGKSVQYTSFFSQSDRIGCGLTDKGNVFFT